MPTISVTRPGADEYNQAFARYIERVPDIDDARRVLATQQEQVARLLHPLDDASAEYRYGPDKWSIKELLGHICDGERIFAYRLLRVGRGDTTPMPGFDENEYARTAGAHDRSIAELVEEWNTVRRSTLTLVTGLPAGAWANRGTSNDHTISSRALLYIIVGHVAHHLAVLAERYGVASV